MSLTNPQDLTARILNPRSKNNNGGINNNNGTTAGRSAHFAEEAHVSHQEAMSSEATNTQPAVSVTGFQNIPPPSALFRTTMASWRHNQQHPGRVPRVQTPTAHNVPHVHEDIPTPNHSQSMASLPRMTAASKNKTREHTRKLAQLARLQSSSAALSKKSSSSSSTTNNNTTPSWRRNPLTRIIDTLKRNPSSFTTETNEINSDPDIVLEFDRDISEFLVSVSGSFLGMNPNELMQSNGLRQLIARNMRWFQNTPDWMKVLGLLIAKKFNGEVRNRTAAISDVPYVPLLSSSSSSSASSSFFNEVVDVNKNDESSEPQPQPQQRSMPIPFPIKQSSSSEDHNISFKNSSPLSSLEEEDEEEEMINETKKNQVLLVASSSSSSSLSSPTTITPKNKKNRPKKLDIQKIMDIAKTTPKREVMKKIDLDKRNKKRNHAKLTKDCGDTDVNDKKKKKKKSKKVSSGDKQLSSAVTISPNSIKSAFIDVIDVDAEDDDDYGNKMMGATSDDDDNMMCVSSSFCTVPSL